MKEYTLTWKIDLSADTPEEAAKLALEIMQDKESTARHFTVLDRELGEAYDVEI